ncbi:L-seryl-tRNA(Sec) selenium transferase [Raineyella fluvialis]|uniref:L-seryl-tRNA(Sec) selenium transferase n=1 Tax=Raineyella fluvialis TaxID=2662261 RepID=A0A5Q2FCQ1_9ACTN|nr:L-seryl-tRNA(Sec) selenium transferase [Raineyella fluvialis]QGF24702.1 L-seryl-tRNA(Sec) selenium transferase [Raineyella fluvialis]
MPVAGDPRRAIPRTDVLMDEPGFRAAIDRLGPARVKAAIVQAQQRARAGEIPPESVRGHALAALPTRATSLRPVINATGVVIHTNIGRAPLSPAAVEALVIAAGYVDVELDLASGQRSRRGRGVLDALLSAVVPAEAALVVNNGAAALVLATTALAAGREVVVSRGEMVEIGDGFRLPDLIASTGARLREVGTTNRTHLDDYRAAIGPETGCLLKIHPSNFRIEGFTSGVEIAQLAGLGVPVIADIGSGLLGPDPALPDEPDATTTLRQGAALVTASGDKLLGGPQAGIVLGAAPFVERLRRHPLARALRVDKLTLAALEATLTGPEPPVTRMRHLRPEDLRGRTWKLAEAVGGEIVESAGRVGGGGAPGVALSGYAVALPSRVAELLRRGEPAVLARVDAGRCLVDLRCVPTADDDALRDAILAALTTTGDAG